jgi:excisionase family DNA binding protein
MTPQTYRAEEVAEMLGVSTWALYESVRRGDAPVSPIKVGRRLVFSRSAVHELLGLESSG